MSHPIQPQPDSIVGSLAAQQPKTKAATGQWLIASGVVVAIVGLIMRLVARSQISKARTLDIFTDPTEAIANAVTLGYVGLAFLIIGGALAFVGVASIVVRR